MEIKKREKEIVMAKMSVKERIRKFAEEYGYSFRSNYSGRFMYGRICIGVSGEGDLKMDLFEFLVSDGLSVSRARQIVNSAKTDDMGLGMIIYFPTIK